MKDRYKFIFGIISLFLLIGIVTAIELNVKDFSIDVGIKEWAARNTQLTEEGKSLEQDIASVYEATINEQYLRQAQAEWVTEWDRIDGLCKGNAEYCISGANALKAIK